MRITTGPRRVTSWGDASAETWRKLLPIVLLPLSVWLGLLSVRSFEYVVLLLLALSAATVLVLCVRNPRLALLLYLAALYFLTALTNERVRASGFGQLFAFLPTWVGYARDAILAGLLIATMGTYFLGKVRKGFRVYDLLIACLFFVTGLSWLVNSVPLFTAMAAVRLLVVMVSGYFVLRYRGYGLAFFETIFKFLLFISLVQFPITVFQRFVGVPILQWGDDLVAGTFSRYPKLVAFQLVFFALGLAAYSQKSLSAPLRKRMVWTAILAVGSMALSNSRIVFFFIPLMAAIILFKSFIRRPVMAIRMAVLVSLVFGVALYLFVYLYGGPGSGGGQELLRYMQNPKGVYDYFFATPEEFAVYGGGRLSRVGAIIYLVESLYRYPGGIWLGTGPGMATEFDYDIANTSQMRELVELHSNVTQASTFLGEFGLMGLTLSMLLILVGFSLLTGKHRYTTSPYIVVIRRTYPAILVLFLLMQFYSRVWLEGESAFVFWFLTVYLLRAQEEESHFKTASVLREQNTRKSMEET